ncbi:hypothetical protein FHL15_010715 [Xylaria flabelliformis]|uniref:FAD dependent oxidoreductase domain-containing protein n=1 Tax=Xylaria flabelliformis TaxID=2512241 RepID=A0A553HKC7_9PEZI|nr:hypothetical protein FHL15_010715 [Xylaria flabelliformis]
MSLYTRIDGKGLIRLLGGGAIGCSAAYYLTRHPKFKKEEHHITLLEATKIAGGASGKAGGCLASWATPICLATLSFDLHASLAEEHDGENHWGYRRALCLDCEVDDSQLEATLPVVSNGNSGDDRPDWLFPGRLKRFKLRGHFEDTGQVHPYLYTNFLVGKAQESGVEVIMGSATAINISEDGKSVKSVTFNPRDSEDVVELEPDHVIIACGPWTRKLLPKVPIKGARSHSVVLRVPSNEVPAHILFFNNPDPRSWFPKLEVYPRPDDTTYVCGPTDWRVPLPDSTELVDVDKESCDLIKRAAENLSPRFLDRATEVEQACYRPVVDIPGRDRSVGPLLGKLSVEGLILAAGHDQWGIQNSAATGKIISELVFDGKATSADISSLDPGNVV